MTSHPHSASAVTGAIVLTLTVAAMLALVAILLST